MQDDTLLGNLTVEETLRYTLDLRVPPSHMTKSQRQIRVENLITDLNLSKVRNTKVCNYLFHLK